MTPEEMAKAVATGKAPCGCHRVVESDTMWSTHHDENCALLKVEEKKAKK